MHRVAVVGVALFVLTACTSGGQDPESVTRPATSNPAPSQSEPSESPTAVAEPEGKLVSAESVLLGKWRPVELYGRPVSTRKDRNGRPLGLDFLQLTGRWSWSANDGCNTTSGHFSVSEKGAFHASDRGTTLVACSDLPPGGSQNVKTPQRADQAWLVPAEGDNPARLTLTVDGVTVGIYEALPGD